LCIDILCLKLGKTLGEQTAEFEVSSEGEIKVNRGKSVQAPNLTGTKKRILVRKKNHHRTDVNSDSVQPDAHILGENFPNENLLDQSNPQLISDLILELEVVDSEQIEVPPGPMEFEGYSEAQNQTLQAQTIDDDAENFPQIFEDSSAQEQIQEDQSKQSELTSYEQDNDLDAPDSYVHREPYRHPKVDPEASRWTPGPRAESCLHEKDVDHCAPKIFGACCPGHGTTALAEYLNSHPQLTSGDRKEHHFFRVTSRPERTVQQYLLDEAPELNPDNLEVNVLDYKEDWHAISLKNFTAFLKPSNIKEILSDTWMNQVARNSISNYIREFPLVGGDRNTIQAFDFDSVYLYGIHGYITLGFIIDVIGRENLKFLIALRNPAYQICSKIAPHAKGDFHWVDRCLDALEYVLDEPEQYDLDWLYAQKKCPLSLFLILENYCYSSVLENWFGFLPKEHFFFIKTEEMRDVSSRLKILQNVADFLKIDPRLYDPKVVKQKYNATDEEERLPKSPAFQRCYELFTLDTSFLTKCNKKLVKILGETKWAWMF